MGNAGFIKLAEKIVGKKYSNRRLRTIEEHRDAYRAPFIKEVEEFLYGSSEKDHILDRRIGYHARSLYKEYFTFNCKYILPPDRHGLHRNYQFYELIYRDNCGRKSVILTGKGVQEYAAKIYEKDYPYKSDQFIKNIEEITGKKFLQPDRFHSMLSHAWSNWVAFTDRTRKKEPRNCCKRGLNVGESIYV